MHELSPAAIKGILVNPIYTGVGPFPRLVEDAAWVRACAKLIEEEGPQQFLVNLLYVLRECFQEERLDVGLPSRIDDGLMREHGVGVNRSWQRQQHGDQANGNHTGASKLAMHDSS